MSYKPHRTPKQWQHLAYKIERGWIPPEPDRKQLLQDFGEDFDAAAKTSEILGLASFAIACDQHDLRAMRAVTPSTVAT